MTSNSETGRSSPSTAVVVPVYRDHLDHDERISLERLRRVLGHHAITCIAPRSLSMPSRLRDMPVERFPDLDFASRGSYSRLLMSGRFYDRFETLETILVYQLDCLALDDSLEFWSAQDVDYIGAPWFKSEGPDAGLSRVGNGGFSLRRISSFRRVLSMRTAAIIVHLLPRLLERRLMPDVADLPLQLRWRRLGHVLRSLRGGARAYARAYTLNEDRFWSDRASLFDAQFRVAGLDAGLAFAFEEHPEVCLAAAGGRLPFGAHAWPLHGRDFWLSLAGVAS